MPNISNFSGSSTTIPTPIPRRGTAVAPKRRWSRHRGRPPRVKTRPRQCRSAFGFDSDGQLQFFNDTGASRSLKVFLGRMAERAEKSEPPTPALVGTIWLSRLSASTYGVHPRASSPMPVEVLVFSCWVAGVRPEAGRKGLTDDGCWGNAEAEQPHVRGPHPSSVALVQARGTRNNIVARMHRVNAWSGGDGHEAERATGSRTH